MNPDFVNRKKMEMLLLTATSFLLLTTLNPMIIAIFILTSSILISITLYKTLTTAWVSFVLVLIFASGMMTLFFYAASLVPNELPKSPLNMFLLSLPLLLLTLPTNMTPHALKNSMQIFSSLTILFLMASVLVVTLIAVTEPVYHPTKTLLSTF